MNKTKEKNDVIKVIHPILTGAVPDNIGIELFSSTVPLKNFLYTLGKPLYAVHLAQRFLYHYLQDVWIKVHQKIMSKKLDSEKILIALARFGPSEKIYRANSLKLHYTPGVDFMAKECCAWDLIMTIKPIFEMLATRGAPVTIKIQGVQENRTKITYYNGLPGKYIPGEEYVEMAFPLREVVLFYAGGVLMLVNEYPLTKYNSK